MKPARSVHVAGAFHTPFIGKFHPDFIWKKHPEFGKRENPTLEEYIARAALGNLRAGRVVSGASTITPVTTCHEGTRIVGCATVTAGDVGCAASLIGADKSSPCASGSWPFTGAVPRVVTVETGDASAAIGILCSIE